MSAFLSLEHFIIPALIGKAVVCPPQVLSMSFNTEGQCYKFTGTFTHSKCTPIERRVKKKCNITSSRWYIGN